MRNSSSSSGQKTGARIKSFPPPERLSTALHANLSEQGRAEAKAQFLEVYARTGLIREARQVVGVGHETVRRWRESDSDFAQLMKDARETFNDGIRAEIYRRALIGWDEPVYKNGEQIGSVHRYSDRLLALLARRIPELRPQKSVDLHMDNQAMPVSITGIQAIIADPDLSQRAADLLSVVYQRQQRRESDIAAALAVVRRDYAEGEARTYSPYDDDGGDAMREDDARQDSADDGADDAPDDGDTLSLVRAYLRDAERRLAESDEA